MFNITPCIQVAYLKLTLSCVLHTHWCRKPWYGSYYWFCTFSILIRPYSEAFNVLKRLTNSIDIGNCISIIVLMDVLVFHIKACVSLAWWCRRSHISVAAASEASSRPKPSRANNNHMATTISWLGSMEMSQCISWRWFILSHGPGAQH